MMQIMDHLDKIKKYLYMKNLKTLLEASLLDEIDNTLKTGDNIEAIYKLALTEFNKIKKSVLNFKKYKNTEVGMLYADRTNKQYDLSFGTPSYELQLKIPNIWNIAANNPIQKANPVFPYDLLRILIVPNAKEFIYDETTKTGDYKYWDYGTVMILTNSNSRTANCFRKLYLTTKDGEMHLSDSERHTFTQTPEEQIKTFIEPIFKDLDTFVNFIIDSYWRIYKK
jgi:hypothetical protein